MTLFINLPKIIVAHDFSQSSLKLKKNILPPLTKYVSLQTTFHIKPKFFLGIKLPENLLLAKYLTLNGTEDANL